MHRGWSLLRAGALLLASLGSQACLGVSNDAGDVVENEDAVLAGQGSVQVAYSVQQDWGSGFVGQFVLTARGGPVNGWKLAFRSELPVESMWNARYARVDGAYQATPEPFSARIEEGQSVTVGFVARGQGKRTITACLIDGRPCFADGPAKPDPKPEPRPDPKPEPRPDPKPDPDAGAADDVYGMRVPRADSFWTERGRIYRGQEELVLHGVNWFGLETTDRAPHGLWTGRGMEAILKDMKGVGFNALRVPVSPESIRTGFRASDFGVVGASDTGRELLELLLQKARDLGMYVLLDFHTCDPRAVGGALPGGPTRCAGYELNDWLEDLAILGEISRSHDNVAAVDLTNEPHALTWEQWSDQVADGARAVLLENPRVLVFVEGVANGSDTGGYQCFWGENLVQGAKRPVDVPRSRLVYSPHAYGPGVFPGMTYFGTEGFEAQLPEVWDAHFGHLAKAGFTVAVGEWGGFFDAAHPDDVLWQEAFADYLIARQMRHFFYWAVNPNSGDTGGVYADGTWTRLNTAKVSMLRELMAKLAALP